MRRSVGEDILRKIIAGFLMLCGLLVTGFILTLLIHFAPGIIDFLAKAFMWSFVAILALLFLYALGSFITED